MPVCKIHLPLELTEEEMHLIDKYKKFKNSKKRVKFYKKKKVQGSKLLNLLTSKDPAEIKILPIASNHIEDRIFKPAMCQKRKKKNVEPFVYKSYEEGTNIPFGKQSSKPKRENNRKSSSRWEEDPWNQDDLTDEETRGVVVYDDMELFD